MDSFNDYSMSAIKVVDKLQPFFDHSASVGS